MYIKIFIYYLFYINNTDINSKFGNWINNIDSLEKKYSKSLPFNHIIIDDFLNEKYIDSIYNSYGNEYSKWHKYYNPLEVKYAYNDINSLKTPLKDLFYLLSTNVIIDKISKITNIHNLEYDKYLHGAGLHSHPRYGRLNMHLDYERHPIYENKQRRINIILFLNKEWKEEWNGENQFWSEDMKNCCVKTYPKFNRALLFQTNEISWHGVPKKILCPENIFRKTIAYYYISPLENSRENNKFGDDGSGYRTKASFIKIPNDKSALKINELYKIRPHRRITDLDIKKICPDWTPEKY